MMSAGRVAVGIGGAYRYSCADYNNSGTLSWQHPVGHPQYHGSANLLLMVSLAFALQHAGNSMENTIDDAVYIID